MKRATIAAVVLLLGAIIAGSVALAGLLILWRQEDDDE